LEVQFIFEEVIEGIAVLGTITVVDLPEVRKICKKEPLYEPGYKMPLSSLHQL
jgi:hypothetical protein